MCGGTATLCYYNFFVFIFRFKHFDNQCCSEFITILFWVIVVLRNINVTSHTIHTAFFPIDYFSRHCRNCPLFATMKRLEWVGPVCILLVNKSACFFCTTVTKGILMECNFSNHIFKRKPCKLWMVDILHSIFLRLFMHESIKKAFAIHFIVFFCRLKSLRST